MTIELVMSKELDRRAEEIATLKAECERLRGLIAETIELSCGRRGWFDMQATCIPRAEPTKNWCRYCLSTLATALKAEKGGATLDEYVCFAALVRECLAEHDASAHMFADGERPDTDITRRIRAALLGLAQVPKLGVPSGRECKATVPDVDPVLKDGGIILDDEAVIKR